MLIYLIRHGETDWNTARLLQGNADIPLNKNGIEVAELTSEALKDVPFDLIFSSPLQRAYQTAEILRGKRQIPIITEPRIQEICFGPFEGMCCSQEGFNVPDPDFIKFFTDPGNYIPPEGGESIRELCDRTTEFLNEVANNPEYQDKTILFSSHGAAVKGLLSSITITDLKDFWNKGVHKNCGVSILHAENGKIQLQQENIIYYDEARSTNYFE